MTKQQNRSQMSLLLPIHSTHSKVAKKSSKTSTSLPNDKDDWRKEIINDLKQRGYYKSKSKITNS